MEEVFPSSNLRISEPGHLLRNEHVPGRVLVVVWENTGWSVEEPQAQTQQLHPETAWTQQPANEGDL